MPKGIPKKSIPCEYCSQPFFRKSGPQNTCSALCKLQANTDKTPGQGPEGECWEWIKSTTSRGYGQMHLYGEAERAHRLAYELFVGPIPAGLCVLHKCDNPPCVRPDHLFVGTVQDNNADMVEKGRQARGETSGRSKFSDQDIQKIRQWYATGRFTKKALADRFGMSQRHLYDILRGNVRKRKAKNKGA